MLTTEDGGELSDALSLIAWAMNPPSPDALAVFHYSDKSRVNGIYHPACVSRHNILMRIADGTYSGPVFTRGGMIGWRVPPREITETSSAWCGVCGQHITIWPFI